LRAGSPRNVSVLKALSAMVAQWSSSNSTSNSGGLWFFVVVEEGAAILLCVSWWLIGVWVGCSSSNHSRYVNCVMFNATMEELKSSAVVRLYLSDNQWSGFEYCV
jgi:hypothetical protein